MVDRDKKRTSTAISFS
jgi:hypothetical protein